MSIRDNLPVALAIGPYFNVLHTPFAKVSVFFLIHRPSQTFERVEGKRSLNFGKWGMLDNKIGHQLPALRTRHGFL